MNDIEHARDTQDSLGRRPPAGQCPVEDNGKRGALLSA